MKGEIEMATVSSDYAVQMHGITKRFGAFYALKDMNLDVKKGSIHSLLGENGAGKSTLMNVCLLYTSSAARQISQMPWHPMHQ